MTESGVAITKVIHCPTVQGERGMSVDFHNGSFVELENGCIGCGLGFGFSNSGRIIIPLEQMATASPSAADPKGIDRPKNEPNSFDATELN